MFYHNLKLITWFGRHRIWKSFVRDIWRTHETEQNSHCFPNLADNTLKIYVKFTFIDL
jgi:hypothetical protein